MIQRKPVFLAVLLFFCGAAFALDDNSVLLRLAPYFTLGAPFGGFYAREAAYWQLDVGYDDGTARKACPAFFEYALGLGAEVIIAKKYGVELDWSFLDQSIDSVEAGGDGNYKKYQYRGLLAQLGSLSAGFNWHFMLERVSNFADFYAGPELGWAWASVNPHASLADFFNQHGLAWASVPSGFQALAAGLRAGCNFAVQNFIFGLDLAYVHYFAFSGSMDAAYNGLGGAFGVENLSAGLSAGCVLEISGLFGPARINTNTDTGRPGE